MRLSGAHPYEFGCVITAITDQTSHKINFESVALQRFQNLSCGSFDRQLEPTQKG
jgi:hypothetical protein